MTTDRLDALLEAWALERARADALEVRLAEYELAAFAIVKADRIEELESALAKLERLVLEDDRA